jgi:Uma2 family endonuclease
LTTLLDMPEVRARMHRVTVEEFHRAGDAGVIPSDVELLRGIIVTKMSKSPLHEYVRQLLMDVLLAQTPPSFKVRSESPLTTRDSEPEPDISVVQGKPSDWLKAHPSTALLAVEITVSSSVVDEQKADIYAEAGILEYWLVRPESRTVDVFRKPTAQGYLVRTTLTDRDILRCEGLLDVKILIADIFPALS